MRIPGNNAARVPLVTPGQREQATRLVGRAPFRGTGRTLPQVDPATNRHLFVLGIDGWSDADVQTWTLSFGASPSGGIGFAGFEHYTPGTIDGQKSGGGSNGLGLWRDVGSGPVEIVSDPTGTGHGQVLRLTTTGTQNPWAFWDYGLPEGHNTLTVEFDAYLGGTTLVDWYGADAPDNEDSELFIVATPLGGGDPLLFPNGDISGDGSGPFAVATWHHIRLGYDFEEMTVTGQVDSATAATVEYGAIGGLTWRGVSFGLMGASQPDGAFLLIDNLTIPELVAEEGT